MKRHRSSCACRWAVSRERRVPRREVEGASMGSLTRAVKLPGRRDRRLEQWGINRSPEPHHAGVGQLDFQHRARAGIDDRYRHEVGARAAGRRDRFTRSVTHGSPRGVGPRVGVMDTLPPVIERDDADTELPTESGNGNVGLLVPLELSTPPVQPRLMTRSQSCPSHGDSPGTASHAVRGRTPLPDDDSPDTTSRAVRGPGYHAQQGWFGRTDTYCSRSSRAALTPRSRRMAGACVGFWIRITAPCLGISR
jgi:hypothetical protein